MATTFEETTAVLALSSGFELGLEPGTQKFVTDIEGWYKAAPNRTSKTERRKGHGTHPERGYKDERLITVSGHFVGANRAEAAAFTDSINAFIADGTAGTLVVSDLDLGSRQVEVFLREPDVSWHGGRDVAFSLDMRAPDPRKYAVEKTAQIVGLPRDSGGMQFPLFAKRTELDPEAVIQFGQTGLSGVLEVFNPGTADTFSTFIVHGPALTFQITELGSGSVLEYVQQVPEGQRVVLDSKTGRVYLEGYADRSAYLRRREWTNILPGGGRQYMLTATGGNDSTKLQIETTPAWW